MKVKIEHINVTVRNPDKTADILCRLFDWKIRWDGESILGGHTVHVGTDDQYLALYSMPDSRTLDTPSYEHIAGLNHVGVEVEDMELIENRILDAGFETFDHGDYEPGRRFYFRDSDNIEYEILSYKAGDS